MYLLDSDVLDYYLHESRAYPDLCEKIDAADARQLIRLPIITVEEATIGAINELRKDYNQGRLVQTYEFFYDLVNDLRRFIVMPFDEAAHRSYLEIPDAVRNSAPNDCRIAAIALAGRHTVITNNSTDFQRIERATGVLVEYWATRAVLSDVPPYIEAE